MGLCKVTFSTDKYTVDGLDVAEGEEYRILPDGRSMRLNGEIIPVKKIEKSRRNAEIEVLKMLADLSATNAKTLRDYNLCADVAETIDNITDEETSVIIDKRDIDSIVASFDGLASRRPTQWRAQLRSLLKQLEKPEEYKKTE